MKVKDWQKIEDLFHSALAVEAGQRAAYVATACGGDESLRVEVESLLTAFAGAQSLMEQPAFSLGLKVLSDDAPAEGLVGRTIGSYKIARLLGRGGMGTVYLAEDDKLDRRVALKFFTSRILDDEHARAQMAREARSAARLDHPNICAVHGLEEIEDHRFIVMQYIEGETLDALLARDAPDAARVFHIAEQVVAALAAAHTQGVIHRDVKPQNVMVTGDGQVKVLDFGLAKVVGQTPGSTPKGQSRISHAGLIVGTVPYMSPEQLRGEPLDFRTDVFSAGVLLYELFSGTNPYKRGSEAETISAILTSPLPRLVSSTPKVPRDLEAILRRCTEKEKERRYASAGELLSALSMIREKPARRVTSVAFAAFVLLALLIAALSTVYLRGIRASASAASVTEPGAPATKDMTLAVLPLFVEGNVAEAESLAGGLTQSLVSQLSRMSRLRVKSPSSVPGLHDARFDPQKFGRDLQADVVLVGRIGSSRGSLTLRTTLLRTDSGSVLWQGEHPLQGDEIPNLHQEIAEKVVQTLQPPLSMSDRDLLARTQTESAEAYRFYLRGRHYWYKRDKENIRQAIDYFKRATEADPLFALAWAGLADSYAQLPTVAYGSVPTGEAMPMARAAARKALEIDPDLSEAHVSLGVVKLRYEWDWRGAENEFTRAIELNPESAPAHFWYSSLLNVTGQPAEAVAASERAKELDPFSPLVVMNLGRAYYRARDYDRAISYLERVVAEDPKNSSALYVLGYVYLSKEMYEEARKVFEKLSATNKWLAAAPLGHTYGRLGRRGEALKILAEMDGKKDLPAMERAIVYIGLGDHDPAFAWLTQAYRERFGSLVALTCDPIFDSLRPDPRFASLATEMNLTP
jgi:serine/threonine protein kinase/tetratricopeptide (TPR) repeat protein